MTPEQIKALQAVLKNYHRFDAYSGGDLEYAIARAKIDIVADLLTALGVPLAACACGSYQSCEVCQ